MVMKKLALLLYIAFCLVVPVQGQLKYIIDDFEGLSNGKNDLKKHGIFSFGYAEAEITSEASSRSASAADFLGERYITLSRKDKREFGGWGKGLGNYVQLNASADFLNFYFRNTGSKAVSARFELQEDDNGDGKYKSEEDDAWTSVQQLAARSKDWQLVSIPLKSFKDSNQGGDGIFNCDYKGGKLACFLVCFVDPQHLPADASVSFDFISFSQGPLQEKCSGADNASCTLGFWSKEGNEAHFTEIAAAFEKLFGKDKKLGVIHFFQPFAVDGGTMQNLYPSVERINRVIDLGYIPLITLENHFVNSNPKVKQPNLYSIIEGHMDGFFKQWATHVKQMKGTVLLRILHEFNGDWYPWCVVNNDKNPELLVKAYRHIHTIFKNAGAKNARFIWCPNSMSVPQEPWNYIMNAYPGDEYVDFVGMDIYNGAEQPPVWRSFRKEGIENYFTLTQQLSNKTLFVCETASREREPGEGAGQNKSAWIQQMSNALKYDMNKIRLLIWFNEKSSFKLNSSGSAEKAFAKYIVIDDHFGSGPNGLNSLLD
jgi:hypothetical protein